MRESEAKKKCPECGGEMGRGYISSRVAIIWHYEKHKLFGEAEVIVPFSLTKVQYTRAHRCANCKLVLFYYGKQEENAES